MFLFFLINLFVIYVLICLFSLGVCSFHVLKHVRLLVSLVFVFALFLCFWVRVSGGMSMHTKFYMRTHAWSMCMHTTSPHTQAYVHAYFNPETLIQVFLLLFLYVLMSYASVLASFYVFWVSIPLFNCLFFFNMLN